MGMAAFKYVRLQSWVRLPLYDFDFQGVKSWKSEDLYRSEENGY